MPDAAHWPRIEELYNNALELPEAERAAFLARVCAGDDDVRREVETLLAARGAAQDFLAPAFTAQTVAQLHVPTAQLGEMIQQYKVLASLGAGGMGEVFLADDTRLQRKVALKLLPAQFAQDAARVRRFEQEARAVSALNHPNIITLFDLGHFEAQYFMATEFIDGRTLRARLQECPRLPVAEALELTQQIAAALQAAHAAGIIHRDIKPENVMLRHDGYVKVLDFGLAKVSEQPAPSESTGDKASSLTSAGMVLGTLSYMSPEQARGLAVDARTDVFSLGVVLYEMLAGARPFTGATTSDLIASILRSDPPPLPPELPAALQTILQMALAKECAERYASVSEFAHELKQLAAELVFQTRLADAGKRRTDEVKAETSAPALSPLRRRWVMVTAAALLLLFALFAPQRLRQRNAAPPAENAPVKTLAVLPFKLLGSAAGDEYLGLSMADALIVKLSNLRQLTVRPTSAVLKYEHGVTDARVAGQALNVQGVLAGRIQKAGENLRVTAQLVRVSDQAILWTVEVTGKSDNLLTLQDAVSAQVTRALGPQLTGEEQQRLSRRDTENAAAHQAYMLGRYFWNKRNTAAFKKALEYFEQAIAQDPGYALAHAGIADIYVLGYLPLPPAQAMPRAKTAALKALELDNTLAEAHASLATYYYRYEFDWAKAEQEYQLTLALSPHYATAHGWYGMFLVTLGRFEEGLRELKQAQTLDSPSLIINLQIGLAAYFARRYDQAGEQFRQIIAMDPNFRPARECLILVYERQQQYDAASAELSKLHATADGLTEKGRALQEAYAAAGWQGYLQKRLEQVQEDSKRAYFDQRYLATIYAGLGQPERALECLERSYENRDGSLVMLKVDPAFDSLRTAPRFQALLRQMGLDK